jgi:hypothetical protein
MNVGFLAEGSHLADETASRNVLALLPALVTDIMHYGLLLFFYLSIVIFLNSLL